MNNTITREMAYLCIGDDIELLDDASMHQETFQGVRYFVVGDNYVIRGESQTFCSCNEKYCWHIFKTVLDENNS